MQGTSQELVYCGLYILSRGLKYFWIHEGDTCSMVRDDKRSLLEVTYNPTLDSHQVAKTLSLEVKGAPMNLRSMSMPEKFTQTTVTLNGLRLRKLTYDPHTIKLVIVNDYESRIIQDYTHTTIVVSESDSGNPEFWKYVFYTGGLSYLSPDYSKSQFPSDWTPCNYPGIVVANRSIVLDSRSKVAYSLRNQYDQYQIRSIDYQDQFFSEMEKILDPYGIELCRWNREKTLTKTDYITYRISQTPSSALHPGIDENEERVIAKRCPVDFEFRCTNMQMFYDFKTKYNNVNLLSNFVEFKTPDKYGTRWTAAVRWGRISEDFNHMYEQDNNSNFSYQCSFNCELFFYEVIDDTYQFIQEVNIELANG